MRKAKKKKAGGDSDEAAMTFNREKPRATTVFWASPPIPRIETRDME